MADTPIAERLQEELSIYIPSEHLKGAIRVLEDATKAENIHLADGETVEEFKNNTYMALAAEATERMAADNALDIRVQALEAIDPAVLPISIGDVTDLQDTLNDFGAGLATKAPITHVHDAAQITSGTIDKARLPVIEIADVNGLSTAIAGATAPSAVVELTGASNTLGLTHAGKWLKCNHTSAMTVTLPPQSSVAWADNTQIEYNQQGAGAVTISPGSGVTLRKRSTSTAVTSGQYAVAGIKRLGLNEWIIFGDLGKV